MSYTMQLYTRSYTALVCATIALQACSHNAEILRLQDKDHPPAASPLSDVKKETIRLLKSYQNAPGQPKELQQEARKKAKSARRASRRRKK